MKAVEKNVQQERSRKSSKEETSFVNQAQARHGVRYGVEARESQLER